ncbi:MAG: GlxA family transcriptional regulator [Paracoccaceae bacterium]
MDASFQNTDVSSFHVGILPVPGFALLSYASTVEPLRAANLLGRGDLYRVTHFADGSGVQSSGAGAVSADARIGALTALDLLIVVAGGRPETLESPELFQWLRQMAGRGVPLAGVSGGPVLLARAGLMQGRRMTVHWEHAPAMAEIAPDLMMERSLYVIDRDRMTCGGGTAPLDMMHALITMHHGPDFAREVSDWFHHTDIRPAGDPQRAGLAERIGTASARVIGAVNAMQNHIADPLSLDQLAQIAGVTARQLNRLFRTELGSRTMAYYRQQRLDVARQLLQGSGLNMTEIALATGFAGSAHFAAAFSDAYGQPPSKYRKFVFTTESQVGQVGDHPPRSRSGNNAEPAT